MNTLAGVFGIFISAAILENVIFVRPVALSASVTKDKHRKNLFIFSLAVLILCTLSALLGSGMRYALDALLPNLPDYGTDALMIVPVLMAYGAVYVTIKYKFTEHLPRFDGLLAGATLSGAVYGNLLIAGATELNLLNSVVYGLGTGCGMVLAIWVLGVISRRMALSDIPRAFKGMPVMLLYLGIISLILYGLLGHNQPT